MTTTIVIAAYATGVIVSYLILRFSKDAETFSYRDMIINLLVGIFSWLSVLGILFILYTLFVDDSIPNSPTLKKAPPKWL